MYIRVFVGPQLRQGLQLVGVSTGAFEPVSRVPKWKQSAFINGYARLTPDELERVERGLNAIAAIQRIIAPARLDRSDGVALKAAVDAYLDGCWFKDLERFAATARELPAAITF